jgi:hypothetical protein
MTPFLPNLPVPLARFPALFALGLACARPGWAQASSANALETLDAYLVQAARIDPAYRADIVVGDTSKLSPGRFPGFSSFLGPFDYRPKTYGELTRAERAALLRDPAFHVFLTAVRPPEEKAAGRGPRPAAPMRLRLFTLTPEEMLGTATVPIVIPPP